MYFIKHTTGRFESDSPSVNAEHMVATVAPYISAVLLALLY